MSDLSSQNVSIASGSVAIVFGALGSSSQSVLRILNVSAEYHGILRFFIHHLFEVVYFQKPFVCALHFRLSFIRYGIYT